jgi:hypothetical protein
MPFPEDAHFRPFYEIGKVFGIWGKLLQLLDKFSQPLGNKTLQQLPDLLPTFPAELAKRPQGQPRRRSVGNVKKIAFLSPHLPSTSGGQFFFPEAQKKP